ncbi:hypothetical protein [Priestia taiwanensis]|uniref:Lipoprotein n=1 Tax=Priestia taiwanensis TaxID=1347902 RepID=A0A917EQM6_9BACI|nr:hypothetical protein [Priestia taiwanensis]MBM7363034.1 hypothetical protein [Priestia taiwanensis]GGE67064.1 hypothetical protein GCM10007140_16550 [Priestia taiwanensis]
MKRLLLICIFFFTGCTHYLPHHDVVDYFKPKTEEIKIDDIHIIELYERDFFGPIFKHKHSIHLHDKTAALKMIDTIFEGHYKNVSFKGIQSWKYVLTFHHLEGNFKEHKVKVSDSGILYEGAFYPFADQKTKDTLFHLIKEYLYQGEHTMK